MNDKPLDCVGVDAEKQATGKHDFKANGADHAPAEAPMPDFSVLTAEQVLQHLAGALTQIQTAFPDFSFSLIGRNISHPGQDLILTRDDPMVIINTLRQAMKKREEALRPKIVT